MVWPRADHRRDVQLFGSALLLMSIVAGLISARLAGLAPASAVTEHAINLTGLCAAPLLILYARDAVRAALTPSLAAWWLPAGGYAVVVAARGLAGIDTRIPFAWLAPILCAFTAAAAIILWQGRADRRNLLVPAEFVVAFLAVLNGAQLIRMEFGHIPPIRAIVPLVMTAGFGALAAFAAWRAASAAAPVAADMPARYRRSGLDDAAARQLLERIDAVLTGQRLHTRVDLTLAQLAAAVGATPHQVSEALNRYAGSSFTDVIMRRRVDDVKAQLLDPANDRFTIEGLGASAGFGSRSALYTAFKRLEGVTPLAFRKSHGGSPSETG
jgi:AraC-like DNA-binding protein